jgi:hypothetical protein
MNMLKLEAFVQEKLPNFNKKNESQWQVKSCHSPLYPNLWATELLY